MKKVLSIILIIIMLFIILINVSSVFNTSFLGFRTFRISSGSMMPYLKVNDLIIIKKQDKYHVNDIVTYEDNNSYVTHRIIKIKNNKYVLKGDANNTNDEGLVAKKNIVGKLLYKFKLIGFNSSFEYFAFFFGVFVIGLVITILIPDKK